MRRREFISVVGGASLVMPLAARAQHRQGMRRLGVLMSGAQDDTDSAARIAAFRQGLQDLGWKDGENIHVDYRWGAGRRALIRQHAQALVALAPDVIVASGTPAVAALATLTRSIPIVCAMVIDPVGLEFAESLSRPGGNITGFTFVNPELIDKWTALLREAAPGVHRAALLYNPERNPWYESFLRKAIAVPRSVAMKLVPMVVGTLDDLAIRIPVLASTPGAGLIIGPEAFVRGHFQQLAAVAAANRLPGISVYRQFAVDGGLMSYGPDTLEIFRGSAGYVDRILKGADPATLPVQAPTRFEFAINQKAATALGLALPPTLLAAADEVIK
ncbi:ABC transporter substrate-binding protein [Vineibacter terrae]|nr:ABC transporter substrate-binding protein [Vineibacter terrae]